MVGSYLESLAAITLSRSVLMAGAWLVELWTVSGAAAIA